MSASSMMVADGDFGVRQHHVLRHRTPHAAQELDRALLGKDARGALHVAWRDHAVGAGRRHHREIDVQLAREHAHRRASP